MSKVRYKRRDFLKAVGTGAGFLSLPWWLSCYQKGKRHGLLHKNRFKGKSHIVTLSFDDGFKKSSIKTAEIYEKYNLSGCINVIATAHLPTFELPNEYHRWEVADFGL